MKVDEDKKRRGEIYFKLLLFNFIFSSVVLVIWVIIQSVFKKEMREYSNNLALDWQTNSNSAKRLFKLFSQPIFYVAMGLNLLLIFTMRDKKSAFNGLFLYYVFVSLTMTLKNLYYDTRPCFVNKALSEIHCECDFGNPSGHSSGSFIIYFWLFYIFLYKERHWILKILAVILWTFCTIVTGISRIQRGAHFLD